MPLCRVTWEIDIEADNMRDAAHKALAIQQDPASTATVFQVHCAGIDSIEVDTAIPMTSDIYKTVYQVEAEMIRIENHGTFFVPLSERD